MPSFSCNESLCLDYEWRHDSLDIHLFTVPSSLENKIFEKSCEIYDLDKENLSQMRLDKRLDTITEKYDFKEKEELIRNSVNWFEKEEWYKNIVSFIDD